MSRVWELNYLLEQTKARAVKCINGLVHDYSRWTGSKKGREHDSMPMDPGPGDGYRLLLPDKAAVAFGIGVHEVRYDSMELSKLHELLVRMEDRCIAEGLMAKPDWIPLTECVDGNLYLVGARNTSYGVFNGRKCHFSGVRRKWSSTFVDSEEHYDAGEPHGTAKPYKDCGKYTGPSDSTEMVKWLEDYAAHHYEEDKHLLTD